MIEESIIVSMARFSSARSGSRGGFTVAFEVSNAETVQDLLGPGYQAGGSYGEALIFDTGGFGGENYVGGQQGIGIGGVLRGLDTCMAHTLGPG